MTKYKNAYTEVYEIIKQYNSDLFASKKKVQDIREEHTELIEYKENILKRIFNKIRQFFHV
ncbi:MAG: hypothetical protein BHV99_02110 [Clostridium sp. 26_21]|nr:MAG: hypothetical protein BHV99_02110 [Clostridium sp. 26_21]